MRPSTVREGRIITLLVQLPLQVALTIVALTRHELVHHRIPEDVRREDALRKYEIMERLLVEVALQRELGLQPQGLHLVVAVVIRRGLAGDAVGVALDFVLCPCLTDLGHEDPTLLITNQLRRSPATLIGRYAQRMVIENGIADGIDFFHMDALSSTVAMKVNCDLQLTLMASSLYRLLGCRIGCGYERAKSRHLFRDFINATAQILIDQDEILVRYHKRAHNPLLLAADFHNTNVTIPWLGGKRLRLAFG